MRCSARPALTWVVGLLVAAVALPALGEGRSEVVESVRIETDGSSGSEDVAAACAAAARAVFARGWKTPAMVVRVLARPFDATAPASDLAVGSSEPVEDAFFRTVEALVRRDLGRVAPPSRAETAARLVAAHLSPRASGHRRIWEASWVAALAGGELTETALVEAAWRVGGDDMLRAVTLVPWPDGLISAIAEHFEGNPLNAVSEVVLAGLVDPSALGFEVDAPVLPGQSGGRTAQAVAGVPGFGVHVFPLPVRASAEGVLLLRSRGLVAHAVARYPFPGQYDVARLAEGEEVAVPLRGVSWAGVVVTSLGHDGGLSLTSRPLPGYPVELERWDFAAGGGNVTISWETRSHEEVLGFVVEALSRQGEQGWHTLRRVFLPVAEGGSQPFSYSYAETGSEDAVVYRLTALTTHGFLAEVGTFPVLAP